MIATIKQRLKNQKGLTLIELLAVVVILAIIAAIAIPAIGSLIDNTKKDAHIANAEQMISAAKLAVSSEPELLKGTGRTVTLTIDKLVNDGYLEPIEDPDAANGADYTAGNVTVTEDKNIDGKYSYTVTLTGVKRSINNATPNQLQRSYFNAPEEVEE